MNKIECIRVTFTSTPYPKDETPSWYNKYTRHQETREEWLARNPEVVCVGDRFYLMVESLAELFNWVIRLEEEVIIDNNKDDQGYYQVEVYNDYRE